MRARMYMLLLTFAFVCNLATGIETRDYAKDKDETNGIHSQIKVEEGDSKRLKCKPGGMLGLPKGLQATWYIAGRPLLNNTDKLKIINSRMPPRLKIMELTSDESGIYACLWQAKHRQGWTNYTIEVQQFPRSRTLHADKCVLDDELLNGDALKLPKWTTYLHPFLIKPAGNVAELKCPAKGTEEITIMWLKNGEEPTRALGDVLIKGSTLKMENLTPKDSGNYTCIATNQYGSINHTFTLEVIEQVPARPIFSRKLRNMTVTVESNVTFEVEIWIKNTLTPYILWALPAQIPIHINGNGEPYILTSDIRAFEQKEGDNMTIAETNRDPQVLTLTNVTKEDSGWYTCIADNSLGTSYSTAYLNVTDDGVGLSWPQYIINILYTYIL